MTEWPIKEQRHTLLYDTWTSTDHWTGGNMRQQLPIRIEGIRMYIRQQQLISGEKQSTFFFECSFII